MPGRERQSGRGLATVFFTDIVGSTALAARLGDKRWRELLTLYHGVVRRAVQRAGGRQVDSAGDGVFAVFASPANAIRCAGSATDELHRLGLEVRSGLHTGEVEFMGTKVGGIAVHLGARVCSAAGAGEILITSTVRDLVAGSDLESRDRGVRSLKGIPGSWHLYVVVRPDATPLDEQALETAALKTGRGRHWWWLPAGIAAGVAAVVAAGAFLLLRPAGSGAPALLVPAGGSVARLSSAAGGFTSDVRIGSTPTDIAVGGGFVWVTDFHARTLVRIDPSKNASDSYGLPGTPTGLAFGAGRVWISTGFGSTAGSPGSVIRFDPSNGFPDKVIALGNGVQGIAFEDTPAAIWVINQLDNKVVRIDPMSGSVAATIDLPSRPLVIAAGGGAVWIGGADKTLVRIDASTNRLANGVQLRALPNAIAIGEGAVWVASGTASSVTRVDPASGQVITTIPVDAAPSGIAVANRAVWVTSPGLRMVDRIDAATNRVADRKPVDGYPQGVAPSGADLWVTVSSSR